MTLLDQYQQIVSSSNGLRFWSIDLHVHTPESKDSEWTEKDPFKILRIINDAGIQCVAITDHFSGQFIDELKRARKIMANWKEFNGTTLPTIIPGVEIEVDGVHLICIFPEKYGTPEINYFLGRIGIKPEDYGNQEANCVAGLDTIRSSVDEFGGLIIAAHANSNKGLLGIKGKNFVDLSAIVDIVEINRPQFQRDVDGARKFRPELANKPFVRGSDAHSESGLNKGEFRVKMQSPNFASLKQMVFEPTSRFAVSNQETAILGISFDSPDGIFGSQVIAFNSNLNTIIGGRGDGKSILMDSIRYTLEDYPSLQHLYNLEGGMLSRINGTFKPGESISIFIKSGDDVFACVRGIDIEQSRKIFLAQSPAKWYRLEAGDFTEISKPEGMRITIYSQGEIESLTRELDVIGEICDNYNPGVAEINKKIFEDISILNYLFSERNRIRNINEKMSEKISKNKELLVDIARFEAILGGIDQSSYRKMLRASEEVAKLINDVWGVVEEMRRIGGSMVGKLDDIRPYFVDGDKFINKDFESYFNHTRKTVTRISEIITFSDIGKFSETQERVDWKTKLDTEKMAYDILIRDSGMESQESLMPRLTSLRVAQKQLSLGIESDGAELAKSSGIETQIQEALNRLISANKELYDRRIKNIVELNSATPSMVYIDYSQDKSEYRDWLDNVFKSRGLNEKGATITKLLAFSPPELLAIVMRKDTSQITSLGITESNANAIVSVIDTLELQDLHQVTFKFTPSVGLMKGGNKFPTNTLSIGERVSAIFPLLTLNTGRPILLDQPEDDLDHHYIIDNITESIRQNKSKQQFIIVTHNPNIPVLADSDQIIKMKRVEDKQSCVVEIAGAIEDDSVRSHIMKLEGGMNAIEIRYRRYRS